VTLSVSVCDYHFDVVAVLAMTAGAGCDTADDGCLAASNPATLHQLTG